MARKARTARVERLSRSSGDMAEEEVKLVKDGRKQQDDPASGQEIYPDRIGQMIQYKVDAVQERGTWA